MELIQRTLYFYEEGAASLKWCMTLCEVRQYMYFDTPYYHKTGWSKDMEEWAW